MWGEPAWEWNWYRGKEKGIVWRKSISEGASLDWTYLTRSLKTCQPHVPIEFALCLSKVRFLSFAARGVLNYIGPSSQNRMMRYHRVVMDKQGHFLYSISLAFASCMESPTLLLTNLSYWPAPSLWSTTGPTMVCVLGSYKNIAAPFIVTEKGKWQTDMLKMTVKKTM